MKKWFCAPDYSASVECEESERPEGWISPEYWLSPDRNVVSECGEDIRPDESIPALPEQIAVHEDWKRSVTASPAAIGEECQRRIFAVASRNCQLSMLSERDTFTADEEAAYVAARDWVAAMKAACRALVAARDVTFADDAHWPACPPEAQALAARF